MVFDRVIAVRNDKTVYRDGNRCLKVFHRDYTKEQIIGEALNHAKIEMIGLQVPQLLEFTSVEDQWAIVFEYIKGKTLEEYLVSEPEQKKKWMRYLCEIQRSFHEKTNSLLQPLHDMLTGKIKQAHLDLDLRDKILDKLGRLPKDCRVCHGDFEPSNIIVTPEGSAYILDWSRAAVGNPWADNAVSYLSMILEGKEDWAQLYLETFTENSPEDYEHIRAWLPVIAASLYTDARQYEREVLQLWIQEKNTI